MNTVLSKYFVIYIFGSIIYLILVFYIVKIYLDITLEKRIDSFAITSNKTNNVSILDNIIIYFTKIIKKISKIADKSSILKNYSNKLNNYLIYSNSKDLSSNDYIALKILIMIISQIFYIIIHVLSNTSFNISSFILSSFISFMSVDVLLIYLFNKKKALIEEQLLQAVVIMNSAFKSGKNIYHAIDIVKEELPNPIKEEFNIISKDMSYGLDLETVFKRFYNRIKLEEAKYITSSLSLLNKTGGNIVTVFEMIERNFYDRLKIKNELNALTSSGKLLYRVLLFMPFVFVLAIVLLNPNYFTPMFKNILGIIAIFLILILYLIYIISIKKIMKVKKV